MIEALEDEGNGPAVQDFIEELEQQNLNETLPRKLGWSALDAESKDSQERFNAKAMIQFGAVDAVLEAIFDKHQLKEAERELARRYPAEAITAFYNCKQNAEKITETVFGKPLEEIADGTNENALYHAMWSALMAYRIGEGKAELFGTAHEPTDDLGDSTGDTYTLGDHVQMDLHNNAIGREICTSLPKDGREVHAQLLEHFGSQEAINKASEQYGAYGVHLLATVRIMEAFENAVQCTVYNGQLVGLHGESLEGKLIYII